TGCAFTDKGLNLESSVLEEHGHRGGVEFDTAQRRELTTNNECALVCHCVTPRERSIPSQRHDSMACVSLGDAPSGNTTARARTTLRPASTWHGREPRAFASYRHEGSRLALAQGPGDRP